MTTGEIDIRSGGVIAVDTESLRAVATVLARAAAECGHVATVLWQAGSASMMGGVFEPSPAGRAELARERADALARALRLRADVYEQIEADATHAASLNAFARAASPAVREEADRLLEVWRAQVHAEVQHQLSGGLPPLSPVAALVHWFTTVIRALDRGAIGPGAPRLRADAARVRVDELRRHTVEPPRSLAEIAERMPEAEDDRVRVEVYELASGQREYIVYIAGTRDLGPPGGEPWDMASNGELYAGRASSALLAAYDAIEAAGARAGDRVHLVGHSQGGMIAGHLAREGGFEVVTLITFATPVQVHPGDDVLTVTVRHTDDPIVALSNGGLPVAAGSRDSFIVERVADPTPRLADFAFGVHQMSAYRDTAAMIDESDDVRVDALRTNLAGLGGATSAIAVHYGAQRDPAAPDRVRRVGQGRLSASTGGAG